ncbi:MAG: glycosyltransferase family 2 protein [Desulfobacterales bacterium]|nr:glycosyltransferase family 2 protein [Desulfobacterales bacterium]
MNISVIIPACNESASIGTLVSQIKSLYPDSEVIIINDGSTDETAAVAKASGAIVYSHPYNIGNGAAIKSGIRIAKGDVLIFMDGDGQHNPHDIPKLLYELSCFDMVVGARPKEGQSSYIRGVGNKIYNMLASYVAKFNILDLTSGFRAIRADIAKRFVYLLPNTYSYPTTLTLCVLRSGFSIKYIPIIVEKRKKGASKIKIFNDGIRFLMVIMKIATLFSPLRIFVPISFFMILLGSINYFYSYLTQGRFTNMSALLFTTSFLIFMMGLISEQICQMRFERSEGERKFNDLKIFEKDSSQNKIAP